MSAYPGLSSPASGVRAATSSDAAAIAAVHVASWQAGYAGLLPDDFLATLPLDVWTANWTRRLVDLQGHEVLVSEEKGRVRGFAACGPSRDEVAGADDWELRMLYIAPGCWRQGIGRVLCARAVSLGQAHGRSAMTLWVLAGNHAARSFYESAGFSADGHERVDDSPCAIPLHELRYRRLLN